MPTNAPISMLEGRMRKSVVLVLMLLATPVAAQEFTALEMEDMEKSTASGCMKGQLQKLENQTALPQIVVRYCQCLGKKVAATASKAELAEIDKFGMRPHNIAKLRKISGECQSEIAR
jgi:hypothetical protein